MSSRKAVVTLLLAGLVIISTSAGSGGCGGSTGDGGTSGPVLGAGGEQSAPSDESKPSQTHDETPNEPSEPPDKGSDPCIAHLSALEVGSRVSATLTVGSCDPEQYDGSLMLEYGKGDLPSVKWETATLIPINGPNTKQAISAPCQDAYWVVVYLTSGRDANGKDFAETYSRYYEENDIPRKVACP